MLAGRRVLAIVPARAGSKGIPHKNMRRLQGRTLIARAAGVLRQLPWIDYRLLSTDSAAYRREGRRAGLAAPFLRPKHLSTDRASAIAVAAHALRAAEARTARRFDVVLIVEPTSPLRRPADVTATVRGLLRARADSAVTVSALPAKFHPRKVLRARRGRLGFYRADGRRVVARQELDTLCWRNGVCYALTRECLLQQRTVFGRRCVAVPIAHPVVNIDEPWELAWAGWWLRPRRA